MAVPLKPKLIATSINFAALGFLSWYLRFTEGIAYFFHYAAVFAAAGCALAIAEKRFSFTALLTDI